MRTLLILFAWAESAAAEAEAGTSGINSDSRQVKATVGVVTVFVVLA